MNKVKRILIVVFLFVVTLNINYLGMIDTKVVVTSKEYKEGNTDNLVLNKILSDNELKQEIPKMFNYASNGTQYDPNDEDDYTTDSNPEYITNGLYSMEDEDGVSYYFRGAVTNNNVQFGEYASDYYVYQDSDDLYYQSKESCQATAYEPESCVQVKLASQGDKMYWKIVRVNGDGSLRLIYNGTSTNPDSSDLAHSYAVGIIPYNLEANDPKYAGYTYDNGTDSFIKKEVDTWYKNALGSTIYDSKVIGGRFCSDSSGYKLGTDYGLADTYYNVFASYDRLRQDLSEFAKDNAPTLKCPSTSESYGGSYRLKAGLITADELAFAGEYFGLVNDGFLNSRESSYEYWSMTPGVFAYGFATVWSEFEDLYDYRVASYGAVRPVINVTTENMALIGDGTIDNPYVLEEVKPSNSYKGKVTIEVGSSIDDIKAFEEELDLSNVTWTVKDSSIAKIGNGKIIGLKNGTTVITGVDANGTTYEIEVTVISNPVTNSAVYIGIGIGLILIMSTVIYIFYRKVVKISE